MTNPNARNLNSARFIVQQLFTARARAVVVLYRNQTIIAAAHQCVFCLRQACLKAARKI
jgi:hypothetical protein